MATISVDMLSTKSKYDNSFFDNLSHDAASFYSDPDKYLEPSDTMRKEVLSLSKKMYDFMKEFEFFSNQNSLKELLVSGFDNEQIWQEIQLQNNPCLSKFKNSLKGLEVESVYLNEDNNRDTIVGKAKKGVNNKRKKKKSRFNNSSETHELSDENEDLGQGDEGIEEEEEEILEPKKKYKKTVVDDDFFRLREMEEYVDKLDRLEEMKNNEDVLDEDYESGSDAEVDLFQENLASSDDDDDDEDGVAANTLQYSDFFDPPPSSVNTSVKKGSRNEDDEAISNDDGNKDIGDDVEKGDIGEDDGDEDEDEDEGDDDDDDDDDDEGDLLSDEEGKIDGDGLNGIDDIDNESEGRDEVADDVDEDAQEDVGKKCESTYEKKQRMMQEKIKKLEEENLNEKPWQLMGEADAKKRPVNSLLEEFVTFDVTSVGAPVITEETTLSLEDLIKQRIKDKAWDDVIRKEKPLLQPYEYKKAPELNQEKSKLSLAEVYEKEYLKEAEDDKEEKENEDHVNIQNLMDRLFVQLDSLSNFHFTPKPPQPEIKIITNVPSLQMEEVLPITMTESSQLAPEEVFEKKKGELVCADENTDTDRKRNRRRKKIKKKFAAKDRERKQLLKAQKAGKVAKSDTKQAMDSLKKGVRNTIVNSKHDEKKNVKSSNDFFNKLQNEVKSNISKENLKQKAVTKKNKSAEFLKL